MFDTHCHVQFQGLDTEREDIVKKCKEKNVILNLVGTQKDTSRRAVEMAEQYPNCYASLGLHPNHLFPTYIDEEESHFLSREEEFDEGFYEPIAKSKKVIAMGETGLDLFHLPRDIPVEIVLEKQKSVFLQHLYFAQKYNLSLVVHCREAHEQLIDLLKLEIRNPDVKYGVPYPPHAGHRNWKLGIPRGVIHCYTGNWEYAQEYLDLGFYLGFTGVITFPPKKTDPRAQEELLRVVKEIPLDRMVVETDAPYLAPQAYRGQRSYPWMVEEQIKCIAAMRDLSATEVETITDQNAKQLFNLI